jgi:hypothetical protein
MKNEQIYSDLNNRLQDQKEFIQAQFTLTRATYKAEIDLLQYELYEIKKRQDIANGKLINHEKTIKPIRFMTCHPVITIIALIIFWFAIAWVAENINIKKSIEKNFDIELKEK